MENKIERINRIYFEQPGSSKYQYDLLLDDFRNALQSFLMYLIIDTVLCEVAEKNITSQEEWDGKIHSTVGINGNYYQELVELRRVVRLGLIVDLRKLTKAEKTKQKSEDAIGSGTIDDFIHDLANLKKQNLENLVTGKPILKVASKNDLRIMQENFEKAIKIAQEIRSKNYYSKLVEENEGFGIHKDRKPQKRTLIHEETKEEPEHIPCIIKTYKDNIKINIEDTEKCFNKTAEAIQAYCASLWWCGIGSHASRKIISYPEYVRSCFKIFREEIAKEIVDSVITNEESKLKTAIELCWGPNTRMNRS